LSNAAHLQEAEPSLEPMTERGLEPLLVARGVVKRWHSKKPPVLDQVDLELRPGFVIGLVGRNGAGKTTLLRILAGLIAPDSGDVRLDGRSPTNDRREYQARIGFASAGQGGLYARMSVRNHLDYWARLALLRAPERPIAVGKMLARFDLIELAGSRVDRLSMGQRQRVRLAMAFLHEPKLVLLDEPKNSLDETGLESLRHALSDFTAAGGAAVWCAPTAEGHPASSQVTYELADGKLRPS
jgi:ABC-type multidrug transport system ATPase subunit